MSIIQKNLKTFLNGKYKNLSTKEFCELYIIHDTTLTEKIKKGQSFKDAVLIRNFKAHYTEDELKRLKSLNVVFLPRVYENKAKPYRKFMNSFMKGKYKQMSVKDFVAMFGLNKSAVDYQLKQGKSLKKLLLHRDYKSYLAIKDNKKEYNRLVKLGVVFDKVEPKKRSWIVRLFKKFF